MTVIFIGIISRILSWLPPELLLWVGDCIGALWFSVIRIRRAVVLKNIQGVFGNNLNEGELLALASSNFQHYGRTLLELLRSFTWEREDYLREMSVDGLENILPFVEKDQGGFILTGHIGNWEMAIGGAAASGVPLDIIIKQPRSRFIDRILRKYREKMGVGVFGETGTAKGILNSVASGRVVAFVNDQFMGPPVGLPVSFFGQPAGTAVSLALLSDRRNIPIWPAFSYREPSGRVHVVFEEPITFGELSESRNERLYQKTQKFNDVLENIIRQRPDQWLWLHRRWKEYSGVPRWVLSGITLMMLLLGCASKTITPTGIELPEDHSVSVPTFEEAKPKSESAPVDGTKMETSKKEEREKGQPSVGKTPREAQAKKVKSPKEEASAVNKPSSETSFRVVPMDRIPFEIGEQLEVDLKWMALPAGRATIEVRKGQNFNGRNTYLFFGRILSSKIVDTIYKVDNSIETTVDATGLIPYKFLLHMLETHQKKETVVNFDHPKKKARYWAKRISERWGNQDADRMDELVPNARDMFSAIYYARTLNFALNREEQFVIYENGQNWNVLLIPVANELVINKLGAFQCWKILVKVTLNNVLRPTGDLYLWLSDDSKRYVIKFDAKIKVGSVYGDLVSIRDRL